MRSQNDVRLVVDRSLNPCISAFSTLDLGLQAALERLAADRLPGLPERASLALLVADLRTREVRALVSGE